MNLGPVFFALFVLAETAECEADEECGANDGADYDAGYGASGEVRRR